MQRKAEEREAQRRLTERLEKERLENLRREQERLQLERQEAERRERQRQVTEVLDIFIKKLDCLCLEPGTNQPNAAQFDILSRLQSTRENAHAVLKRLRFR